MGFNNSWLFLILFFIILSETFNGVFISSQCLKDQSSLLLQLKGSLNFDTDVSTKLVKWSTNEDCCIWNGVGCDTSGHVISLELDNEFISGGIENSTSLFKLQYLQKLNLAYNNFSMQIPSGIVNLKSLVYLDLREAGFDGQIPIELSNLRKLVYLALSTSFMSGQSLQLENPNLTTIVQNLQNLEELYLDGVHMSARRSKGLASSLPRLRILSLRYCGIEGPIDASLSELRSLSVIQLDGNNLSTTVPSFFANYSNLTTLSLSYCDMVGTFPAKILQVPTLQYLDLSENNLLSGSLITLDLHSLISIDLSRCNFSGPIPPAIANLSNLVSLDLSYNSFTGPIPLFHNSKNLLKLDLKFNSLTGNIPSSIFSLPLLVFLDLSNNQLSGQIDEFHNASSSQLVLIYLRENRLNGSIPEPIFELRKLRWLSLSSNSFSGTIQMESIINLVNLTDLDLSHNKISVNPRISNPSMLPQLTRLGLASCKLKIFPELASQSFIYDLDLSDNQITGEIPNWIWRVGNRSENPIKLNLSSNLLVGLQKPYNLPESLITLDLHSNHLQGDIPSPPASAFYVDYSSNKFNNSIPPDFVYSILRGFFSLANNSLTGSIPESLCNATFLEVLDLSQNSFNGKIPSCVFENLGVLNLARNNLTDSIPDTFSHFCGLQTLDLSSNDLRGKIPRSLINCTKLEVLNIGNNKLEDTFPCNLKNSSSLRVLVLRSNKLYGDVVCRGANKFWPELQIIDIASNNFTGVLTPDYFSGWRRMMLDDGDNSKFKGDYLRMELQYEDDISYQDKVSVTIKGQEMELFKILKIFISIDFSNNKFSGEIPDTVGNLISLHLLNLSHNAFMGRIASSIGKLKSLESLDLSMNQLSREVPSSLANLNFLSFLNLSFNNLSGRIPTGSQLQTFSETSYAGNSGLCGSPLNLSCINDPRPSSNFTNTASQSKAEIRWEYVLAATGYSVGLTSFISVLLLCKKCREKYFYYVDKLLLKIVKH